MFGWFKSKKKDEAISYSEATKEAGAEMPPLKVKDIRRNVRVLVSTFKEKDRWKCSPAYSLNLNTDILPSDRYAITVGRIDSGNLSEIYDTKNGIGLVINGATFSTLKTPKLQLNKDERDFICQEWLKEAKRVRKEKEKKAEYEAQATLEKLYPASSEVFLIPCNMEVVVHKSGLGIKPEGE